MVYIPIKKGYVYKTAKSMVGGSLVLGQEKRNTDIVNHASISGDGYLRKSNVVGGILKSGLINHETNPPTYKNINKSLGIPQKRIIQQSREMRGAGLLDLVKMPQVKSAKKKLNSLKISL